MRDSVLMCKQHRENEDRKRIVCRRDGHNFRVYGEFGTFIVVMCERCADSARARGWKVVSLNAAGEEMPLQSLSHN